MSCLAASFTFEKEQYILYTNYMYLLIVEWTYNLVDKCCGTKHPLKGILFLL